MSIKIEEITKQHNRDNFDCGSHELNQFLKQQARQAGSRHISKTYVACYEEKPVNIIGFHTLTGYSVIAPPEHKLYRKYSHPLSAVKLARLAVDKEHQGNKLGQHLLIDAIHRTVVVAEQIAAIGLFVDPMNEAIMPFYEQFGFLKVNIEQTKDIEMWLPISTCIKAVR